MNERIAVLTAGWNREFLNFMMQGICQRAAKDQADVYLFNCYGDQDDSNPFNIGEYNLFHLPDLSKFSGIILFSNNISSVSVKDLLCEKILESKVCVISVEYEIEGMDYIGIDNYSALSEMVEHLITHHHYKDLHFIGGPKNNYEASERKRAFTETLEHHKIQVQDDMITYTNYSHDEAYDFINQWLESGRTLPQAFVCANDDLAIGVSEALSEAGIRVPEDVAVTGYDNFDAAINYSPRISTVDRAKKELGYASCDHLFLQMQKINTEHKILLKSKPIFSESCGCYEKTPRNHDTFRKQCFRKEAENRNLDGNLRIMSDDLVNCDSFHSFREKVHQHLKSFHIHTFYLMVENDEYDLEKAPTLLYRTEGYNDTMTVTCAIEGDVNLPLFRIRTVDLFPGAFYEKPKGDLYIFSPIHFQDRSIGYCVIKNSTYLLEHYFLYNWLTTINSTIENIRQKRILNAVNEKLNLLYMKDFLTDLYNRFGYERMALPLFEKNKAEGKSTYILFMDLDCLKSINDSYGHNHGDLAIITLANTLRKYVPKDALSIRYGGDEFLVVGTFISDEHLFSLIESIEKELKDKTLCSGLPYKFSTSCGYVVAGPSSDMSLDTFVEMADSNMYLNKQYKKQQNS